jgi:hypothetical protein
MLHSGFIAELLPVDPGGLTGGASYQLHLPSSTKPIDSCRALGFGSPITPLSLLVTNARASFLGVIWMYVCTPEVRDPLWQAKECFWAIRALARKAEREPGKVIRVFVRVCAMLFFSTVVPKRNGLKNSDDACCMRSQAIG